MEAMNKHAVGCHCGKVRYEVTTDPAGAIACNCSHCAKHGLWLTFVKPEQFELLGLHERQPQTMFRAMRTVARNGACRIGGHFVAHLAAVAADGMLVHRLHSRASSASFFERGIFTRSAPPSAPAGSLPR